MRLAVALLVTACTDIVGKYGPAELTLDGTRTATSAWLTPVFPEPGVPRVGWEIAFATQTPDTVCADSTVRAVMAFQLVRHGRGDDAPSDVASGSYPFGKPIDGTLVAVGSDDYAGSVEVTAASDSAITGTLHATVDGTHQVDATFTANRCFW